MKHVVSWMAFLVASSPLGLGISVGLRLCQHVGSDLSRFVNCPEFIAASFRSHRAEFSGGRGPWCASGCVRFKPDRRSKSPSGPLV